MKKIIAFVLVIAMLFVLTACTASSYQEEQPTKSPFRNRFDVYSVGYLNDVYVDRVTGVCYLFVNWGYQYGGGLTVMVDANGSPLIYKEE